MSDQKPDASALLADFLAREDQLRAYLSESNDARIKVQNEYDELEQEMADLRAELQVVRQQRDNVFSSATQQSWWSYASNLIKRWAKK